MASIPEIGTRGKSAVPTRRETRHYPALDGLRGVAALVVVAYHVSLYFQLAYIPSHAYLAVDFFFMLSGFVVAYAYDGRLAARLGIGRFLLIRLIRLYPLAVLGVCIGTSALLVRSHVDAQLRVKAVLEAAVANLFLLPSSALLMIRPLAYPTDSPLWSLAFEIWINALYALLFPLLTRPILTAILVLSGTLLLWVGIGQQGLNIGFYFTSLYFGAVRVIFPFVAGVLLHRVSWNRGSGRKRVAAHAAWLPLIVTLAGPVPRSGIYDVLAVLIVFPVILYFGTLAPVAVRLDRIWSALGALSYPLYVIHFPIVVVMSNVAHQRQWQGGMLDLAAAGTFSGAILLSVAALNMYDLPIRRFLTKRFIISPGRVAASGSSMKDPSTD